MATQALVTSSPPNTTEWSSRWLNAVELASQPGMPSSVRGVLDAAKRLSWTSRPRQNRGGGREFLFDDLPAETKVAIRLAERRRANAVEPVNLPVPTGSDRSTAWEEFERKPEGHRAEAYRRFQALRAVADLVDTGTPKLEAYDAVAKQSGESISTIRGWFRLVKDAHSGDWLPLLAPKWVGRTATREYDERIYHWYRDLFLSQSKPPSKVCYRRVAVLAQQHGLEMPPLRTLERHFERREDPAVVALEREGERRARELFPYLQRDRSGFRAMEALNADGHKLDLDVIWPDGERTRAYLIAFQDLYSNKYVGWRLAKAESAHELGLAFLDVCDRHGIPEHLYVDNTLAMASKRMTAGAPGRKRFKDKEGDPLGVIPQLGVKLHWVMVASGQSKPIERSFRDVANAISKNPLFEGAYLGNSTENKPENYGTRTITIDELAPVVERELYLLNAAPKRRTDVCRGILSFDEAFERSYAQHAADIRRISPAQRRLLYLVADVRPVVDGVVEVFGNRYWSEDLVRLGRTKVVVRYHPTERTLHDAIHVYRLTGDYIGEVPCYQKKGFADADAAQQHNRARRQFVSQKKKLAKAARRLDAAEVAKLAGDAIDATRPAPAAAAGGVLRPAFGISTSVEQLPTVPARKKGGDAQERVAATLARAGALFDESIRDAARLAG